MSETASPPASPAQIARWAKAWENQFCQGHPARVPAESLCWVKTRAFVLARIDGFVSGDYDDLYEEEKERDLDSPGYFEAMCSAIVEGSIEEIFVVEGKDGKFYVWEGAHRTGMAHMLNVPALPAFVGYRP